MEMEWTKKNRNNKRFFTRETTPKKKNHKIKAKPREDANQQNFI